MKAFLPHLLAQQSTTAEGLADIREPVRIVDWLFWGGAAAVGILLLLLAVLLYRRLRAARAGRPSGPPPPPPGLWARAELDRIAEESPAYSDKAYAAAVSDVVRGYLERAYDLPAPERTTEEFLAEIGQHPVFTPAMRDAMSAFLQRCDLVKFAGQALPEAERPRLLDDARAFVEEAEKSAAAGARQPEAQTA